tara:strand:- start:271 stop:1386 length:1116 start_codon:yes stop_codon:yes gene_type:complete
MIEELIKSNCIKVGDFVLKNGNKSKYYFDMKLLISYPELLKKIGDELYKLLPDFDIICGIPYGGLPIATYISVTYNKPMIYVRNKEKTYGTKNRIEGVYKKEDRCAIIDDVMTTGGSLQEAIYVLSNKVNVVACGVIFDRLQAKFKIDNLVSLYTKTDVVKYRLEKIRNDKKSELCFSADHENAEKVYDIINEFGDKIVIVKIHFDTIEEKTRESFKNKMISLSIKHDFLIMEDRKFNDICHIVSKQYTPLSNWVDMVTVHALVSKEVIQCLSGAMIVANMSNNNYDFSGKAYELAKNNTKNVIGFISQKRIGKNFICMTPGVALNDKKNDDQIYRSIEDIDSDFKIVGRAIYNTENPTEINEIMKKLTWN